MAIVYNNGKHYTTIDVFTFYSIYFCYFMKAQGNRGVEEEK
jgi:hypothetical protein